MTPTGKLLRELIAIPSINPAFLPPDHPLAGEEDVGDFLASVAGKAGLEVDLQPVLPDRQNIMVRLGAKETARQRILLAPHLDTVGVSGKHQFSPVCKKGRLYGRGACDTKGSVASMLTALMEVSKSPDRPRHTEIYFAGLIDEENAQAGSRALVKDGFKADLAIVGEPTTLKMVSAHKGDMWIQLETKGKPAHGACPELGKNAVHEMARIVEVLETVYRKRLRRKNHPLLGHATSNVGTIQGGIQPNIVPARATITIDRRTLPGETEKEVLRELQLLLKEHGLKAAITSTKNNLCRPLETNPRLPLVQKFMSELGQKHILGVHFFCDAAVLAAGKIPSVVFGPGDIAQAHTEEEWISLESLEKSTRLLKKFLLSLP